MIDLINKEFLNKVVFGPSLIPPTLRSKLAEYREGLRSMHLLIPLGAYYLILGATTWLLVGAFRSTRSSGYLVLLAGLLAMPFLGSAIGRFITAPAIEALAVNGPLTTGELFAFLGVIFKLFEGTLVLQGLWLVVRNHNDPATPANKRLERTGAAAPAAEPQLR